MISINICELIHRLLFYICNTLILSHIYKCDRVDIKMVLVLWGLFFLVGQAHYFFIDIRCKTIWMLDEFLCIGYANIFSFAIDQIQRNLRFYQLRLILVIFLKLLIFIFFLKSKATLFQNYQIFLIKKSNLE